MSFEDLLKAAAAPPAPAPAPAPALPPQAAEAKASLDLYRATKDESLKQCILNRWCRSPSDVLAVVAAADPSSEPAIIAKYASRLDPQAAAKLLEAALEEYAKRAQGWLAEFLRLLESCR